MDLEKLTQKSREALTAAQAAAAQYGHTEVDAEHLAQALLAQESGLAKRLFEKMGVPVEPFQKRLAQELERRPRVSGPGREPGKVYITGRLEQVLREGPLDNDEQLQAYLVREMAKFIVGQKEVIEQLLIAVPNKNAAAKA